MAGSIVTEVVYASTGNIPCILNVVGPLLDHAHILKPGDGKLLAENFPAVLPTIMNGLNCATSTDALSSGRVDKLFTILIIWSPIQL